MDKSKNAICGILVGIDLYDYIREEEIIPIVPESLKYMRKCSESIEKEFWLIPNLKKGEYIYGDFGVVFEKYAKLKMAMKCFFLHIAYYK